MTQTEKGWNMVGALVDVPVAEVRIERANGEVYDWAGAVRQSLIERFAWLYKPGQGYYRVGLPEYPEVTDYDFTCGRGYWVHCEEDGLKIHWSYPPPEPSKSISGSWSVTADG